MMSDIVIEYEELHFPIEKPSPAELIKDGLKEPRPCRFNMPNSENKPSSDDETISSLKINIAPKFEKIGNFSATFLWCGM